jgi:single-strand DNA-binding protein
MNTLKNKVQLIGNLGQDPEVKETANGKKYAKFSLATNEIYKNQAGEKITETQWHNIILWGKIAEIAEKYLKKGSECAVEGKLVHNSFEGEDGKKRYYTQIEGRELLLLGKKDSTAPMLPNDEKKEVLPF